MTLEEFKEIERDAENNDALAINKLALCYEDGKFVEKNDSKMLELLRKSASLGCPNAMVNLAQRIFEDNEEEALGLLKQACEMNFFGAYFVSGLHAENLDEKLNNYRKAAELGYPVACLYAGSIYNQMGNIEQARKYWEMGAKLNEPECCHNLAIIEAKEFKDFKKAAIYAEKAYENGNKDDEHLYEYFDMWCKLIHTFTEHNQEIKYWTNKKGISEKIFTVSIADEQDINDLSLLILAPRYEKSVTIPVSHVEIIKCRDFLTARKDWEEYKSGTKSLKDIHPTQKAKYIISMLHLMEEDL